MKYALTLCRDELFPLHRKNLKPATSSLPQHGAPFIGEDLLGMEEQPEDVRSTVAAMDQSAQNTGLPRLDSTSYTILKAF